jgi:TetR/AcrR family transcriptional repressor of uid operon
MLHQPGAGPVPGDDAIADRIAAAALEQFAEFGIRRSTMDDIARRAGVSKMTVFRRFTNKQGLVEDVIARELRRALEEIDRRWGAGSTIEERLVEGFVFAVSFVSGHPLFDKLLRAEPEMLLPLLTVDGGPVLALYRTLIAERLQVEVDAGRAAPADVDQAAEVIARLGISLLLTREGSITLDDRSTIEALVRDTLLPMLRLPGSTGTPQQAGTAPAQSRS